MNVLNFGPKRRLICDFFLFSAGRKKLMMCQKEANSNIWKLSGFFERLKWLGRISSSSVIVGVEIVLILFKKIKQQANFFYHTGL